MPAAALPPGPSSRIPGYILCYFTKDRLKFFMDLTRYDRDVAYFKVGPQPFYFVNHPDYIRDILVTHNRYFMKGRALQIAKMVVGEGLLTSEGAFHLRQRRLMQPAFHHERIAGYARAMTDYSQRRSEAWKDGDTVDINAEMMRLTLAIVTRTLFNADVESEAAELGEALSIVLGAFNRYLMPFSQYYMKLPLPFNLRAGRAKARLDRTIYRIIDERRASGKDAGDLLSMLLMAQDVEGDGTGMTDQQVHDEAITLFIAGHETTAQALSWTWYLLARHPDAEARFHEEIDAVLDGRMPGVEDLPRLPFTRKILTESLRLYPPAYAVGRRALADYPLGPYVVPEGAIVIMSQYVMHRDPRFYDEPERFDPDRWTPDFEAGLPKYAFFPFGGGARMCIGEQFAWMEGMLLLATLGRRWRMRLVPGHPVVPHPSITLRSKHGLRMTLERRA